MSADLFKSIIDGKKKEVKTLIEKGGDALTDRDGDGRSALHYAAFADQKDFCTMLLKKKVPADPVDAEGKTPLMLAAECGHYKTAMTLYKAQASLKILSRANDNMLHFLLRPPKWNKSAMKLIKACLESGVSTSLVNADFRSPFYDACDKNATEAVQAMIKFRPDVNAIASNGETPGHAVARHRNGALLKLLLENGCDISIKNAEGVNVGEAAAASGLANVMRDYYKHVPGGERMLRQQVAIPPCVATKFSELPVDLQQLVAKSKLPLDRIDDNWDIFCNVCSFAAKRKIYKSEEEMEAKMASDSKADSATKLSHPAVAALSNSAAAAAAAAPGSSPGSQRVSAVNPEADSISVVSTTPKSENTIKSKKVPSNSLSKLNKMNLIAPGTPKTMFKRLEETGKGGFGMVFSATDPSSKKTVAIKRMPHSAERDRKNNLREIYFLKEISHPNLVSFVAAFLDEAVPEIWVVMEMLEGGTLDQAVQSGYDFKESHIAFVAGEMLRGLSYLHSRHFAHRDLKAANVMMSIEGQIKIIDFGLAVDLGDETGTRTEMVGSPYWMPPEMIKKEPHGCVVDIWSMAVCLLELANHEPPSRGSALLCLWNYACEDPPQLAKQDKWSAGMKDFMKQALIQDPAKRATADQLLKHPLLSGAAKQNDMKTVLRQIFLGNQMKGSGFF